ncbi:MAG: DUF4340 domain-containing protein [Cyanobacteriota bacterium]
MNFRTTGILSFILIVLISYNYFSSKNKENTKIKQEESKKITTILENDVTSFIYKNRNIKLDAKFTNEKESWVINYPISSIADGNTIFNVLDPLLNSVYIQKLENISKLEDFGLKEPKIIYEINTKKDHKVFKLGNKSTTDNEVYVMKDNDPNIYLVDSKLMYSVDRRFAEFRYKTILDFDREKTTEIELTNKNTSFILKKEKNYWNISSPYKAKANMSKVSELLNKLQNERATDFVEDNPKDLKKYGLDKPWFVFSVKNGKNTSKISFGNQDGDFHFAQNNQVNSILRISRAVSEKFKLDLNDLRDKK